MNVSNGMMRSLNSSSVRSFIALCGYLLISRGHIFLNSLSIASSLWILIVSVLLYYILKCLVGSLYALFKVRWKNFLIKLIDGVGCLCVLLAGPLLNSLITTILISSAGFCQNDIAHSSNDFRLCEETYIFGGNFYLLKDSDYALHLSEGDILLRGRINDWVESLRNEKPEGQLVLKDFGCQDWMPNRIGGGYIEIWDKCG